MFTPGDRELATTTPVGWNSWNAFNCGVTEANIRTAADRLVETGLPDAGYECLVVDDCWMDEYLEKASRDCRVRCRAASPCRE